MIIRCELADYLDNLLACHEFKDYAPNGLQVEGARDISAICTAVTASFEVIEQVIASKVQALLVHHGYFWRGEPEVITGQKYQRLKLLLQHNINLFAYHLPLDCHMELGNNACFARLLPVEKISAHSVNGCKNLLWSGYFTRPYALVEVAELLQAHLARTPVYINNVDKPITKIAWCTGAAQDFIIDAHKLGADAYISGEISERTYYQAKELGIHYLCIGHHASERYGIQALGQHLAEKFHLHHQFIDSSNPI